MTIMCRSRYPSEIRSSFLRDSVEGLARGRSVTLAAGSTAKKQGARTITLSFSESQCLMPELSTSRGKAKASST